VPRAGLEGGILVSLLALTPCTLNALPWRVLCLYWWYVHDLEPNLDRVWKSVQNRWYVIRTHALACIVRVLQACSICLPVHLPVQKSTIKCIIHKIHRTLLIESVHVEHHMDWMALYLSRWTITLLDTKSYIVLSSQNTNVFRKWYMEYLYYQLHVSASTLAIIRLALTLRSLN